MRTPIDCRGWRSAGTRAMVSSRTVTSRLMRLLVPHLRRAVTISNVLDVQAIEKARMAETLDALKLGVVLANEDSRILHANRAAEEMMRDGGPLRDRGGVLRAEGERRRSRSGRRSSMRRATRAASARPGLAVRLTEEDEAPVVAHVLPLAGGEVRTRLEPAAVAAVFVNPKVDDAASAQAVAATYGLTPAETRVLTPHAHGQAPWRKPPPTSASPPPRRAPTSTASSPRPACRGSPSSSGWPLRLHLQFVPSTKAPRRAASGRPCKSRVDLDGLGGVGGAAVVVALAKVGAGPGLRRPAHVAGRSRWPSLHP